MLKIKNILWLLTPLLLFSLGSQKAFAAAVTWAGGTTGTWETGTNWSSGTPPTSADDVTINRGTAGAAVTLSAGQTADFSTLTIGGSTTTNSLTLEGNIGTGGSVTIKNLSTITQKNAVQQVISGTLTIESGGSLTHTANTTTVLGQLYYINWSAATINAQSGSTITAAAKGYAGGSSTTAGQGPGAGAFSGGGGAHAGNGGNNSLSSAAGGTAYCDMTDVDTMGSGGAGGNFSGNNYSGGAGGGLIILNASGTATLSGAITAAGSAGSNNGRSGGGAGGGIRITANTIAGTPTSLTAAGGTVTSGGSGGGGCIQFTYTAANSVSASTFLSTAAMIVTGSTGGAFIGGAGSFYVKDTDSTYGDLVLKNTSTASTATSTTVSSAYVSTLTYDNLYLNAAVVAASGVTVNTSVTMNNASTFTIPTNTTTTFGSSVTSIGVTGTAPTITVETTGSTFNATSLTDYSSVGLSVADGAIWGNASTLTSNTSTSITLSSGSTVSNIFTSMNSAGTLNLHRLANFTINDLTLSGGTTTLTAYTTTNPLSLSTLTMSTGSTLTHTANTTTAAGQVNVLNITATTIDLQSGSTVTAAAKGYAGGSSTTAGQGPGAGAFAGGGGAHAGNGGASTLGTGAGGTAYCDMTDVDTMGSGGAGGNFSGNNYSGGAGGGLIMLNASGTATLSGAITAAGSAGSNNSRSGGGAGGGIRITANTIAGTPTSLTAAGGTVTRGGSGGGGCIQFTYTTSNTVSASTFLSTAAMIVTGSTGGNQIGGSGSFFVKDTDSTYGDIVLKNTSTASTAATTTVSNATIDNLYTSAVRMKLPGSTINTSVTINNGSALDIDSGAENAATFGSSITSISVTGTAPTITNAGTFTANGLTSLSGTITNSGTFNANGLTSSSATITTTGILNVTSLSNLSGTTLTVSSGGDWNNNSTITTDGTSSITLSSGGEVLNTLTSFTSAGTLAIYQGATHTITDLTLSGGTTTLSNFTTTEAFSVSTLTMTGTSVLEHTANTTAQTHILNIAATTINIGASASINVDGKGYNAGNGPAAGTTTGGGGHCGNGGGTTGGTANCNISNLVTIGSSGAYYNASHTGGRGGGLAIITVAGTATINGTISANGSSGGTTITGGGGGGGIKLVAGTITGTPANFRANGGAKGSGGSGGGGGGGGIYISYSVSSSISSVSVTAGSGSGTAASAGLSSIVQSNAAPTASTPATISQATNGSGYITFQTTISDTDDTKLKVEYSDDGGSTWYDPLLVSATPSAGTTADLDNANAYQIGTSDAIDTSGGDKTITIVWDTLSASNGGGSLDTTTQADIQVRLTANDATSDSSVATSLSFSVDNLDPTISSKATADLDGDGYIDAVHVTFAENIADSSVAFGDFAVTGTTSLAFSSTTNSDTANDDDIYLTFTDGVLSTSATPNFAYTAGTLTDAYGNALASAVAAASTDGAGPAIMSAVASDESVFGVGIDNGDTVTITFSEDTNQATIDASTINSALALNNSHVWTDGGGAIGSASWSSASVLVITLSTGTTAPTVALSDTITLNGTTITDGTNNSSTVAFSSISGVFASATPAVTVSAISGATAEAGDTGTFTVVLGTQPTGDVVVGLSSSDTTEGTVSPASLTFTSGNWSTPQTVTVTGVNDDAVDGDIAYSIITAAATSTDGNYNTLNPADVSATNTDNDTAGITISAITGNTTEPNGTATFTAVLTSQPTADVTFELSSNDTTEGTVSPASLTFTSGNWSTPQTVTVTGVNDDVSDGDIAYSIITAAATSTDGNYNALNPADVSATNTDNDTVGFTISSITTATTEAGGTATFTAMLNSQPTADVTFELSSNDTTEGTVSPASLTFTSGNWSTPQTVTVTGVNDDVDDGDIAFSIITAAATSTDVNYNALNPGDVSVTNTDNDTAGFTVSSISAATTEAGGTATFTVVLTSQPTADVTFELSSNDTTEGTISPASLTFTSGNWSTPQTGTVTGVNDDVDDGDISYSIITAAATSTDGTYNTINPGDVSVTNTDNDTVGFTISSISTATTEAGGTATFTAALNSQPTADVTFELSSNDTTEGTVSPASLTFTSGNWSTPQTVTVTGVNDDAVDGDIAYSIITAAATSTDVTYNAINPGDVSVTNTDNDSAGFTVSAISNATTEVGGTATFTMVLTTQPSANVSVGLTSNDTTEGTVSPASLTFTSGNWSTPQTVTVTGVDDDANDGDISYSIVTAAATSTDGNYNTLNASDVSVSNTDNDTVGFVILAISDTTTEAGGTATFTVVLNSQPTANVSVGLSSSDTTEGTVSPASLTFTSGNWSTPQTVTVTGVNDDVVDGNIAYSIITAAASSTDPEYNTMNSSDVSLTNNDNDIVGITVTPTSGLTTTEAGGTDTFTVVLDTQPTADVSIEISSGSTDEGTVSPASLTFTSGNWATPRTVTVTGVNDDVDDGDVAYTIVTAAATSSDEDYNTVNAANVSVTNTDNDTAGITVTPTSGLTTTEAGVTDEFTVVLDTKPTATVSFSISSSDTTEGTISASSLSFTTTNWATPQTVTVTGVNDDVDDGDGTYSIVTAAATSTDNTYNNINPSNVSVTNTDNDTAGFTVSSISNATAEAGDTATFTVVLNSQPTADVSIELSSSDTSEGTISPASLTFTSGNWNTPQTGTVTGVNDNVDDGDIAYSIILAAATSADSIYNGINPSNVSVTNTDNDTFGITVSTISNASAEASGTATFTVVLTSQPTANVSIGISSSDTTEGTVSPASLTFTTLNWNTAQTVTVSGVNDDVVDGDIAYSIVTAAATSSDGNYNTLNPANVSVTNTDDDTVGFTVSAISEHTTEAGGTATFTVALNSQPTANVSIALTSNDTTEGTVTPASLTFTSVNWDTPQTVTVTGVNDNVVDDDIAYSIITAAATSSDNDYNDINPGNVSVTNNDNDTVDIIITESGGSTRLTEGSTTDSYTVVLNSEPTASVIVTAVSNTQITNSSPLTFTTANWDTPQTITLTAVDDTTVEGAHSATVTHTATSDDSSYHGITMDSVTASITDNDVAAPTTETTTNVTSPSGSAPGGGTSVVETPIVFTSPRPAASFSLPMNLPIAVSVANSVNSVTINTANQNVINLKIGSLKLPVKLLKNKTIDISTDGDKRNDLRVTYIGLTKTNKVSVRFISLVDPSELKQGVTIERGNYETEDHTVVLQFNPPKKTESISISNNPDFENASWTKYTSRRNWRLSAGSGKKNIYVKFRLENGEIIQAQDSIMIAK